MFSSNGLSDIGGYDITLRCHKGISLLNVAQRQFPQTCSTAPLRQITLHSTFEINRFRILRSFQRRTYKTIKMKQQPITSEHEAIPTELSWNEMMALNVQVDYDAILTFNDEDDDSSTEWEVESSEIQGEQSISDNVDSPRTQEVEQETSPSAGFEIVPSVEAMEELSQHVIELATQVDDLKTELKNKTCELQEERDQRISKEAEVQSLQEEMKKLQKMLEKKRHLQDERDHGRNVPETTGGSKVSASAKVTTDKSLLQQVHYYKREAEKYASRHKGLVEVMIEEYKVRLKYEEQLKRQSEQIYKFKEQEALVGELKVKLKTALENNNPKVSIQPEVPLQPVGSLEKEQRKTFMLPGVSTNSLGQPLSQPTSRPQREEFLQTEETKRRQTSSQQWRSEERQNSSQQWSSKERQTTSESWSSKERQTSSESWRSKERQTPSQPGVFTHDQTRPLRQPRTRWP